MSRGSILEANLKHAWRILDRPGRPFGPISQPTLWISPEGSQGARRTRHFALTVIRADQDSAGGGCKSMISCQFLTGRALPKHHYGNRKYTCGKRFQKLCSKSHKFPLTATARGKRRRL